MKLNRVSKVAIGVAAAYGIYSALGYWALPAGLKWAASGPVSDILGRSLTIGEAEFNPWSLELTLKDVKLAGRTAEDRPVTLGSLYTNVAGFSSLTRFGLVIDALSLDRFSGELSINENGETSFQDIIDRINERFPSKEEKEEKGEPFRFSLNNLTLTNSDFRILAPSHGVDENLTEINLGIPFIGSIGSDREINVKPELTLKDNGSPFEAHGQTLPFKDTMATQMHAEITDYDLPHLAAMSPVPLDAEVTSGKASISADVTFAQGTDGGGNTVLVAFSAHADDFAAAMKGGKGEKNAVAFKELRIDSGEIDVVNRKAEIAGITLTAPDVRMERLADGSIAWANVVKTEAASDAEAPAAAEKAGEEAAAPDAKAEGKTEGKSEAKAEEAGAAEAKGEGEGEAEDSSQAFLWTVKSASITGGHFRFEDSAAKGALIEASELEASAANVTMNAGEATTFDLSSKVLDGSVKASGSLTLADLAGQVSLTADKLNLKRVSGYAETAGMTLAGIASAKADADLALKASALSVRAQGDLALDSFELAAGGDSPMDLRLAKAKASQFDAAWADALSLKVKALDLSAPHFSLSGSGFSTDFEKAAAQALSLGLKGDELSLGAQALKLTAAEVKAGSFDGKAKEFTADALKVGWNGKTEAASVSGSVRASGADIAAGAFSATADTSAANGLGIDWQGKKKTLAVASKSVSVGGTAFKASPASGGASKVDLASLALSVDTNPGGATKVSMADIASQGASLAVSGDTPVKASIASLALKESQVSVADTLAFSTASIAASGLKSSVDVFDFNAESAQVGATAFSQGSDMALTVASADLTKAQAIAPVNAARVSALSDTAAMRSLDWKSGASGHANLESASVKSTAFEIAGGKTKFGRIDSVSVTGVQAPASGTISVADISIAKPRYSVSRDAKGNLDIDPLLGKRDSAGEAQKTRAEMKKKVQAAEKKAGKQIGQPVRIGQFSVTDGELSFVDGSIKPAGKFRFGRFNAQVKPVVYGGENTPSTLTMSALINGAAKLSVTGSGSPFVDKGKLTAKGTLTAVSMPFFSPYSVHYVSYPIQKGNLSITTDIEMTDMTKLKTENHVLIEQLGWGNYMPNDTSTSLPVTLATALLTDGKGNLEFDLPVSGDLADPQFSFTDLVLEGLKNLIIKVVAAPVNLVASLATFGTGGASSQTVFVPYLSGQSRLTDQQKDTVSQIAKALQANPKAKLEITPVMSPKGDNEALHQRTYSGLLRVVQSTLPENERSREAAVNALFALQFPDDKTTSSLSDKEAKLYEAVKPDFGNMTNLADSRSRQLARAVTEAGIAAERIFITAPEMDKKGALGGVKLKFLK